MTRSLRPAVCAAALMTAMVLATAAAAQTLPKLAPDTPYGKARDALRKLGYAPVALADAQACDKADPRCFPEAYACAGTGLAQCVYTWRKGRAVIEVVTEGEEPVVADVRCRDNCR